MATENLRYNITINEQVTAVLAKIEARLASLEAGFGRLSSTGDKMNGWMKGSFMMGAAGMIQGIASSVWGLVDSTIASAGALQSNTNAIRVASGSSLEFSRNTKFLEDLTSKMPVSLEAASEGFKMWSGAVMGSSMEGAKGRKIFEQVSTAAAAMGIYADDTKGIFLALGQMVSKGTVQAEELKGQLGERLPGAFQLAAKAMGVTTRQLGDLMKQGAITADDLLPRLGDELEKRFKPGLDEANKSINASTTRLENMRTRGLMAMTPAISEFMYSFTNAVEQLGVGMDKAWEKSEPLKDAFGTIFISFQQTAGAIWDTIEAMFTMFGGAGEGIPIMKLLGTMVMNMLVPLHLFNASLQLTYRLFETIYLLIGKLIDGDFSGMGDVLTQQAGKIEDVFLNTFDNIADGYKNIWTDEDKSKIMAEGDGFARDSTNKGGGSGLKGLLSGSLFDEEKNPTFAASGKKKKGELERASSSISGSAPRNVSIQISSLIGQNNNYISNVQSPMKDLATFMDNLKQALQQEIVDVSIQGI